MNVAMVAIVVPRVVADLVAGPEPPLRLIRPSIASVDDALEWLKREPWPTDETDSDEKSRDVVYRLRFGRYLVDKRRVGHDHER